eukprot:CAMPEP_0115584288 /NCGR_PEP_ID=MMETSP0272-20121206/6607_1 /TAXON_ID=71861 /ORGANISM="Scrippsiella trochoidea, Strain CCMP3099" /LENGTH=173 /DNA_ID=CAMNT_0003019319 /DNA_START=8 /DNA_END=531 /DNA_ORIENTATION=-
MDMLHQMYKSSLLKSPDAPLQRSCNLFFSCAPPPSLSRDGDDSVRRHSELNVEEFVGGGRAEEPVGGGYCRPVHAELPRRLPAVDLAHEGLLPVMPEVSTACPATVTELVPTADPRAPGQADRARCRGQRATSGGRGRQVRPSMSPMLPMAVVAPRHQLCSGRDAVTRGDGLD